MRTSSVLAFAAVAVPAVLAGPFFTSPIVTTSCAAGQQCTISWNEDNVAPLLAEYGDCTIGVYAGSQQQQSLMQAVAPANAATTGSVVFTPDPAMGENSNAYFIKMISVNAADPTNAMYKATAYSAMFTLTGMTGTFNETVKAQIAGTAASSGAVGSGAPATVPAATSAAASTTAAVSASASGSGSASRAASTSATRSASASSSSASTAANGASAVHVAGLGAFGATVAAIFAAFL